MEFDKLDKGAVLVPLDTLERIEERLSGLYDLLAHNGPSLPPQQEEDGYVEPGPGSPRQFFTANELMERWGWGKTKVYEIPESELPAWKVGNRKQYFWAHVWAFEGRMPADEADRIYSGYALSAAQQ